MGGLPLSSNRQRRTYNFLTFILLNSYGPGELNTFWAHMKLLGFTTEVFSGSLELQSPWTAETRQDWSLGARSEHPDDPHSLFQRNFPSSQQTDIGCGSSVHFKFPRTCGISPWVFSRPFFSPISQEFPAAGNTENAGLICGWAPNREAASSARRFPCST